MSFTQKAADGAQTAAPSGHNVNPWSPELIADPYPYYAQLRSEAPVYLSPTGAWLLTRYADILLILRDPHFGRGSFVDGIQAVLGNGPLLQSFSRWMLFLDPPDHTRLRALVNKAFTPKAVEGLRGQVQQVVDELLDGLQDATAIDLIADFAHPLPVTVICGLLGVPAGDRAQFGPWSAAVADGFDAFATPQPEVIARANEAAAGLTEYFRGLVAARRKNPQDDLLSALIAAEDEGERLSEEELLATCVMLLFGGHHTTVGLIGNGMLALLRHPDQLAQLRADPSLIQSAIEELLRYDSPVQRTARTPTQDVEIGGQPIRQGERVVALLGAGNRDPAQFHEPDRLDLTRADNHHLGFGAGGHYCIGGPLARVEAQIAISTALRRLPGLRLRTDSPVWRQTATFRGLQALPVAV